MNRLVFFVIVLCCGLVYLMLREPPPITVPDVVAQGSRTAARDKPTERISLLYSSEKDAWIRAARTEFVHKYPQYQVVLVSMNSFEAVAALLADDEATQGVTMWSPASSLILQLLAAEWQAQRSDDVPFALAGQYTPQSLLNTPLTYLVWKDQIPEITDLDVNDWKSVGAQVECRLWISCKDTPMARLPRRGYTNPSRSNSGLLLFYLLAFRECSERRSPEECRRELTATNDEFELLRNYVQNMDMREIQPPESTVRLTADMARFGPEMFQAIATYENLALEKRAQVQQVPGESGELLVVYPSTTIWADHPVALLRPERLDAGTREAALRWIDFLRSEEMQRRAIDYGFRPANGSFDNTDATSKLYLVPTTQELEENSVGTISGEMARMLIRVWHSVQDDPSSVESSAPGRFAPLEYR